MKHLEESGARDLTEQKAHLLENGWCVVPEVLSGDVLEGVLARLWSAVDECRRRGSSTFVDALDPNAANVRVRGLIEYDDIFRELIQHPVALDLVEFLIGPHSLVSQFLANIARPGSGSMSLHSDQAVVAPEPWLQPWAINIVWCLTDVYYENGATLFVPDSHKVAHAAELGENPAAHLRPFEAKAGSIIAMDGRLWHTSGANITTDQDRPMLFGFYTRDFLRSNMNWSAFLSPEVQAELDPALRARLGLEPTNSISIALDVIRADLGAHRPSKATSG